MRYRAPVPADAPAVLAVFEAREIADLGEVEQTLEELRDEWHNSDLDLERDAQVVEDAEGRILAYAAVRRPGAVVVVAPEREGRGVGARLLKWTESRERDRGSELHRQWVAATNASARSLLTRSGYRRARSYSRMVVALEGLPACADPPAGFVLRPVDPACDAVALHAVDAASFAPAPDYVPESLHEFTREHLGAHDFDPGLSRVVTESDTIVGFLLAGRRPAERVGHVHILAVAPGRQDRGLGTAMLQSAFAAFARAGVREVRLGVASYNPRALHVYERLGMRERLRFDIYERPVGPAPRVQRGAFGPGTGQ
ncbi:MAG TPA: GNAT family N-acetyltransferase [Solirubrobacteraceae bacterium]|nr:GNAT family N-acetyltransferase [Solirubrobacteraceae bacterium]